MTKTRQMRLTELEQGSTIEQLIADGLESGKTLPEVAASLGLAFKTLYTWCELLGLRVERRYVLVRDEELAGVR